MPFLRRRPPSPSLTATLTGHGKAVNAVGFSPGGRLLASGCADKSVTLWDVTDPAHAAQRARLAHPGPDGGARPSRREPGVRAVGFSADGRLLATGAANAKSPAVLWDVTDPARLAAAATLTGHRDSVLGVAFSPDGRLVASCGTDKTVRLWQVS